MQYLYKIKELILDAFFPPICLHCKKGLKNEEKNIGICGNCLSLIAVNNTLFCGDCKARLPENAKICHKNFPYLLGAATKYDGPVKSLIHQFKYQRWTKIGEILGSILVRYLENLNRNNRTSEVQNINDNSGTSDVQILKEKFFKDFAVIPIPLHKDRQEKRGFNQSELLGKIIAEKFNLPIYENLLVRKKETKPQAELKDWDERKNNINNSFSFSTLARRSCFGEGGLTNIKIKNIILIDDVYTSGATMDEAARILKESGAKKIIALVVAKAG